MRVPWPKRERVAISDMPPQTAASFTSVTFDACTRTPFAISSAPMVGEAVWRS